ncbi:MAG: hypothetical protein IRY87_34250, partial [Acetobacteraceae bacterium]|nr:hypothetical protein [Acetobacteraceae bacterium]
GRREVNISAEGSTGAATGAAAGGVLGAQAPGGILSALGGVSGALVGGLIGTAAEHTVVDTKAFEYVVRTEKGDLLSVTQRDAVPLVIGQRVLVITGNQARIVPDYTTEPTPVAAAPPPAKRPEPIAAPAAGEPATAAPAPAAEPVSPPAEPATPSAAPDSPPAAQPETPEPAALAPTLAPAPAPESQPQAAPPAAAPGHDASATPLSRAVEAAGAGILPPIVQPVASAISGQAPASPASVIPSLPR